MKRIEIGYICGKGGGHFSLIGNSDHGVCGSHVVGLIYMESDDPKIALEEQADKLGAWIENAEKALDSEYWRKNE